MDKWTFGFTMLIVGTGGTFLTIGIVSMFIALLKRLFPSDFESKELSKRNQ